MTSMDSPSRVDKFKESTKEAFSKTQASTKNGWDKTKTSAKEWVNSKGEPGLRKATDAIGVETFWPTDLDQEAEKAARIVRSFCIDGFGIKDFRGDDDGGKRDSVDPRDVVVNQIPAEVTRGCRGLCIFTAIRQGFLGSRAGGSGIVLAKNADGSWSPPSAVGVGALGVGLQVGADIFDCICVINNEDGMEGFKKVRCTVGGQAGAAAGPLGGGVQIASEVHARQAPVWTYTKGRGLYVGVEVKGTVIIERESENERFYGVEGIRNADILASKVKKEGDASLAMLYETLKAAQGEAHDASKLPPRRSAPDDAEVEAEGRAAVPEQEAGNGSDCPAELGTPASVN